MKLSSDPEVHIYKAARLMCTGMQTQARLSKSISNIVTGIDSSDRRNALLNEIFG